LLLQLAHPWVAAAIEQHSDTFADPVGRFHRTFSVVFSMVFGTLEQGMSAARRLHRRHAGIKGATVLRCRTISCWYILLRECDPRLAPRTSVKNITV
jgi:ER-bound oxygenase mpaB/B'/Rubber oxygenase, catalytic domain